MQNLGKHPEQTTFYKALTEIFWFHNCSDVLERMSEIQYQNRILLRKMLQIDLNKSKNVVS